MMVSLPRHVAFAFPYSMPRPSLSTKANFLANNSEASTSALSATIISMRHMSLLAFVDQMSVSTSLARHAWKPGLNRTQCMLFHARSAVKSHSLVNAGDICARPESSPCQVHHRGKSQLKKTASPVNGLLGQAASHMTEYCKVTSDTIGRAVTLHDFAHEQLIECALFNTRTLDRGYTHGSLLRQGTLFALTELVNDME